MSNRIDTKIILGKDRFKSSINTDLSLDIPMINTQKEMDEYDRSVVLSLQDVFNEERQSSSIIRFTTNIDLLFNNTYYGISTYSAFTNQMFYLDSENSFQTDVWSGFPQYKEFDFIRTDNNINGYTLPPNVHVPFVNEESTSYNWNFYLSYPYTNDSNKVLKYYPTLNTSQTWTASNGIPYRVVKPYNYNGQNYISLVCPVEHNFQVGQYVEIKFGNTKYIEEVLLLGDSKYDSEKYILNISTTKLGTLLPNGGLGTLKRISDISNSGESMSLYYVRKHRIITKPSDVNLTKAGFEQNGFGVNNQFNYSLTSPDNKSKVTQKHGNQSYNLTFKRDIDITPLRDNWNRPISQIFLTIINRGYFGWFHNPIQNNIGTREGHEFNIQNFLSPYWSSQNNNINLTNITLGSYNTNNRTFYFNRSLSIGDTLNGDFCEFNQTEQQEYVLSEMNHKIYFNNNYFAIDGINTLNPPGYYYRPHHKIKIRDFSDYLEEGSVDEIEGVPNYAFFSQAKDLLIWRDLFSFGFVDENGLGVDYPFINGTHYITSKVIFRLKPEGFFEQNINNIDQPTTDDCE